MGQKSSKCDGGVDADEVLGSLASVVASASSAAAAAGAGTSADLASSSASAAAAAAASAASTSLSLPEEVVRQTRSLQKVATISYADFLANINQLNALSSRFLDANGKQLVFAVKKGTDAHLLWKATVRVACVKIDADTKDVESYKTLNLKEFLQVFRRLQNQSVAMGELAGRAETSSGGQPDADDCAKQRRAFDAALEATTAADASKAPTDECCICLERQNDLILPCAHSYCLPCIEQWNTDHKTCPVCRESLTSTDDGWVMSDCPDSLEIATEIQKSLMSLTQ